MCGFAEFSVLNVADSLQHFDSLSIRPVTSPSIIQQTILGPNAKHYQLLLLLSLSFCFNSISSVISPQDSAADSIYSWTGVSCCDINSPQ